MKPSDVEYCPLHFQPCHILDYYVNTRVMRFANFPEVVRGSRKVCKNREIAHCYCITTWKVVVAKYYEVARRSAKFRACECLNPGIAIKHYILECFVVRVCPT